MSERDNTSKLSAAQLAQRKEASKAGGAVIKSRATKWRVIRIPERVAVAAESRREGDEALWRVLARALGSPKSGV